MRSLISRLALGLALAALLGAAPVSAQQTPEGPTLVVANPSPGDTLTPGKMTIEGIAFDPIATEGVGIDRVSVFMDSRDSGGMFLGDATLGKPNFVSAEPAQFAHAGWMLTTPALKGTGDGHELFVYARSAVTGDETVLQIPVTVGENGSNMNGAPEQVSEPFETVGSGE